MGAVFQQFRRPSNFWGIQAMFEGIAIQPFSQASLSRRMALASCSRERHAPASKGDIDSSGVRRTTCKTCGCQLVKSGVSRWYRSGLMG